MSHIYVYSPSGAVRDRAAFRRGVERLRSLGHEVEVDTDALRSHERFAGDDDTRVAAIHRATASGADVALISRGGYGLTRILGRLRYPQLARAAGRGMRWVGCSDFTALQLALLAKAGATTWAGPGLCEGFGAEAGVDEIMQACFDDLLAGQGEGAGWHLRAREWQGAMKNIASRQEDTGGDGQFESRPGTLWGGNLSVLVSLLGTPWWPGVRGGILFLEDVGEHPYRIERMLTQLLHAGVLAAQQAVVLGQFTEYRLYPHDRGFSLNRVVDGLRSQLRVPVLTGLPFGHVPTKVLLPVGARVRLVAEAGDAFILWAHGHPG